MYNFVKDQNNSLLPPRMVLITQHLQKFYFVMIFRVARELHAVIYSQESLDQMVLEVPFDSVVQPSRIFYHTHFFLRLFGLQEQVP